MLKRLFITLSLVIFLMNFFATGAFSEEVKYIAIVPFHAPEKIWHLYTPFVDYLNKNTDIKWELKLFPNNDAIANAVCSNEISIGLFGPVLAYRTHKECNAKPLIGALEKDGKLNFKIFIVSIDPKIKSIKDLKDGKVGIFKPATVANILTKKMLADERLASGDVEFVIFQHLEGIINSVLTGEIKAGGVRDTTYQQFQDLKLNILKVSDPVPGFMFFSSPAIHPDLEKKFTKALLKLKPLQKPEDSLLVKNWDEIIKYGFILPPKDFMSEVEKFHDSHQKYK